MERVINFGKYKGTTWLQAPIEYLVWLFDSINKDISEGKIHNAKRLELVEYWLNERHLENDEYDKKEEWTLEEEKAHLNDVPMYDVNMNLSPEDVAKFIIGTYGYDFASMVSNDINIIVSENTVDDTKVDMPML